MDHYVTPPWALERLLEWYTLAEGASVLDPCAANGELLTELKRLRPDLRLFAIELRQECGQALSALVAAGVLDGCVIGDFFGTAKTIGAGEIDYIVTNPPYSLAKEFIDEGNRIAAIGNVHLLRVNFLGSKKRRSWNAPLKPGLGIMPNRPSYTGWGGDATEYAWFVYKDPKFSGRTETLTLTPDSTIKEWNARARLMFPDSKPKKKKKRPPAPRCAECKEEQYLSPGGITCDNGHGGAESIWGLTAPV